MGLSQNQIESCQRMEAQGGPATQEEKRLYDQYQREKKKIQEAKKSDPHSVDPSIARAKHGMEQLEKELADLEKELNERQERLDSLVKQLNKAETSKN